MKKRILALALAGTTAFSVFGAAMSASAIQQTNTVAVNIIYDNGHTVTYYGTDDAYLPYVNVAKTIVTDPRTVATVTTYYKDAAVDAAEEFTDVEVYLDTVDTIADNFTAEVIYSMAGLYFTKDGNVLRKDTNGKVTGSYDMSKSNDIYKAYETQLNALGIRKADPATDTDSTLIYQANSSTANPSAEITCANVQVALAEVVKAGAKTAITDDSSTANTLWNGYLQYTATLGTNNEYLEAAYKAVRPTTSREDYKALHIAVSRTETDTNSTPATVTVKADNDFDHDGEDIEKTATGSNADVDTAGSVASQIGWAFTSQDTSAEVAPYTLDSEVKVNSTKTGYNITTTAVDNNTVYAYDFIPAANGNVAYASTGSIAWNWNYGTVTATADTFGPVWVAEDGRGTPGIGVRYSVVSDWLDFLDELGINHDGTDHYVEDFDEFKDNYRDLFYLDNVYDEQTGLWKDYEYVDLYNIQELLRDIYDYSYKSEWSKANTSELVYLMQQYNKYIGDYISTAEVANDDWGDLLLSILDAATEADFKNAKEYKKYTNKVTSLRDAYEEATTTAQIYRAEADMYDLLTNYGAYGYTAKGDFSDARKELGAAINGLYFNATTKSSTGNVIPTYTTEAATQDKTYAKYTNYEYLVAASKTSYSAGKDSSITFSVNKAAGYYSLYPMADYIDWDTATPNEPYAGNSMFDDFAGYATEEYEWFWNVYQLAANMYNNIAAKGNHYTGSIEAVIDALADAVEDMNTLTTASKTATAAVEELEETYNKKQQGFVVTGEVSKDDFDAGYYGMYEEAVAYADVFTGKAQAEVAANIMKVAGESLTYQGTQTVVTKNDMKAVESAIAEGEKALKALVGEEYNAAQVNALNKAVSQAKNLLALYEGEYATYSGAQSVDHSYTTAVRDKDQMLKSDLAEAIAAIDDAINYSEIVMGWNNTADGWTYGTEDGYLNDGWHKIGSVWYYFDADNTAKQSEWMQEDGKWYWFNSNCGAAIGWAKVEGEWYYFGGDNAMKTGWQKVDGNWYYLASSGKMTTGWVQVGGKWYYMSKESNSLGQMLANTTVEGYKLGADGAMIEK